MSITRHRPSTTVESLGSDTFLLPAKVGTILCGIYAIAAQAVAVLSVVEIGPNLLAAVTSVIGGVVFISQLVIANRLSRVKKATESVGDLSQHNAERVTAVEKKVNGDPPPPGSTSSPGPSKGA